MSLSRISAKDRDEWLKLRLSQGIGGSEAAACVGLSPWKTPLELWKEKTGVISEKDLSDKESVSRGVRLEPALRELYRALHPEYNVEYYKYDLLFQSERPWLFATLDGEIVTEDGTRGILEIKTSEPANAAKWQEWADGIPQHYYCQCLHQLLATGYAFAVLFAALIDARGTISLRQYEIYPNEHSDDMEWLLNREKAFYEHCAAKTLPPQVLIL